VETFAHILLAEVKDVTDGVFDRPFAPVVVHCFVALPSDHLQIVVVLFL
jgi:hypothetical protein